ncbi:PDDEXK family nuclease [Geminicoccus harenae]|uniref:hypothetical protein n=1 Tax=Geminicoccus harenae TaxID=2498453 RepID=UPI00168BEBE6|nr:hypothetical protein [Geminicoccus harenae]
MSEHIYQIDAEGQFTELQRSPYDSELFLQELISRHPALLNQVAGEAGALLLVRREQPVPDAQANSRWYLDHLFLDREAVPVLVEVKRATDTRARRDVVAQMLDYAANGIAFWPIDQITAAFAATATANGQDPDDLLAAFLQGNDPETFWRQVEANLRSGRIRLVFAADHIPRELTRIVEFLNEQMRPAEVLAIEIDQFTSVTGHRTLVPRLVGATERARSGKAVLPPSEPASELEWLGAVEAQFGPAARAGAEQLIRWFREDGCEVVFTDNQVSLCTRLRRSDGKPSWPFLLRKSSGRLELSLRNLTWVPGFQDTPSRVALLARFQALPAEVAATGNPAGWPSIALSEIIRPACWSAFTVFAREVLHTIRNGPPEHQT